jgi:anti-sigma B factor antagonist
MNNLSIVAMRTDSPETVVLKSSGSINSSTVPQLDSSFNALLRNGQNTIVLDLSETEFISSSGVGLLLGTVSSLRETNGDLVLMNPSKLVNDILDVLNIKMHFRIIKDVNELKVGARP